MTFHASLLGNTTFSSDVTGPITAIFDTECLGLFPDNLVYDLGITFVNGKGEAIAQYCALVEEIYTNAQLMKKAYFANKVLTDYPYLISRGHVELKPWLLIQSEVKALFEYYSIDTVAAYNIKYDLGAFIRTHEFLECSGSDVMQPMNHIDLWKASCHSFMAGPDYKQWARDNQYWSKAGNLLTNAECANRFLAQTDFVEDHTALSDSVIEGFIFKCLLEQKANMFVNDLSGSTWQCVNNHATKSDTEKAMRLAGQEPTGNSYRKAS